MELAGKVVVVTGGASGIGQALARRFAAEGAKAVVVADLDAAAAERAAQETGASLGLAVDVSSDGDTQRLVETTEDRFGPIDLFCANAGIGSGLGLDAPDEVWDRMLDVNVRAHVLAARRLVPGWVARGEGYFLSTASAAGLLTQIGDAPYAVTKHAAVAFAEWLSVTYGQRGVGVSCLCPMGVDTPLLRGGLGQQDEEGLGARVVEAAGAILPPQDVAEVVVHGLRDERFLILPHPEVSEFFRRRGADHDRWLQGMQRLQSSVAGAPPA